MAKLSNLISILLAVTTALADLKCANLTPQGSKNNHVKVYFYAFQGYTAPTLNANASVGNPWQLSNYNTSKGATFNVKTCNSTTLGSPGTKIVNHTQSSCSHGGCYVQYTNYVQIINPSTGHCLTALNYNSSRTQTGFKTCDTNPKNLSQLWQTDQQVTYPLGGSIDHPSSYGTVDFNIIELAQEPDGPPSEPYLAWALSSDYKDIEVIQYQYTQNGILAELLQA